MLFRSLYYAPDGVAKRESVALPRYGVGSLRQITSEETDRLLRPALAKHGSLWLLTSDNATDSDPAGVIPAWLDRNARYVGGVVGERRQVALYTTDPVRSVDEPTVVAPDRAVSVAFDGGPTIVGYDLASPQARSGDEVRFAIYWRSPGPLPADAHAALRLFDMKGILHRESRVPISPANPPDRWRPDGIVRADYVLSLPAALRPDRYTLALGVSAAGRDLTTGGTPQAMLARMTVVAPPNAPVLAPRPAPSVPTSHQFGDRIRLVGFDLDADRKSVV